MRLTLYILIFSFLYQTQVHGAFTFKRVDKTISEYFLCEDSLTARYENNTHISSQILYLTNNDHFYIEFQHSGPFGFAFGNYKIVNNAIILEYDSEGTKNKIEIYKCVKKKTPWNYYSLNYFDELDFIFNDNEVIINRSTINENPWLTLKKTK